MKQKYFVGIPTNAIPTTSYVPYMTNAQWPHLVDKWSNPRSRGVSYQNMQNRGKVKWPQATGSSCYVAQLHEYNNDTEGSEVNEEEPQESVRESDEELDAEEAFKVCHTSRKKGMSDTTR